MLRRVVLLAAFAGCLQAHRLDEYLQAALISLEPDSAAIELNLTPGVAVFNTVIGLIDTDRDGVVSPVEQTAYVNRVLADISLAIDRRAQPLRITGVQFPPVDQMREGLGTIRLTLQARFESQSPGPHHLRFENHHHLETGAFLANALLPPRSISITRQTRDERQTVLDIDYSVDSAGRSRDAATDVLYAAAVCGAVACGLLLKVRKSQL